MNKFIVRQFICFALIGLIGTGAHYTVLILMVHNLRLDPVVASVAGFMVGGLVNYFLNYRVTFQSKKRHNETIIKFFSIAIIGLFINTVIMSFAINILTLHYLVSQVIATGFVLIWNFAGNRFWTFKEGIYAESR